MKTIGYMLTRTMALLAPLLVLGCSTNAVPRALGVACVTDTDCLSMQCETASSRTFCSEPCTDDASCSTGSGLTLCWPEGFCGPACTDDEVSGTGVDRMVCVAGSFTPCSETESATTCGACGCEPFGGGVCSPDGCVVPQPDGEMCNSNTGCMSGLCFGDTSICGQPRATGEACSDAAECAEGVCHLDTGACGPPHEVGEPCTIDAECTTENCSTDGDTTSVGVCNQALGSPCRRTDGNDTCTRCIGTSSFSDGICSRRRCDPTTANHCPRTSRRTWECGLTVDGDHRCFEQCNFEGSYSCLELGDSCHLDDLCY